MAHRRALRGRRWRAVVTAAASVRPERGQSPRQYRPVLAQARRHGLPAGAKPRSRGKRPRSVVASCGKDVGDESRLMDDRCSMKMIEAGFWETAGGEAGMETPWRPRGRSKTAKGEKPHERRRGQARSDPGQVLHEGMPRKPWGRREETGGGLRKRVRRTCGVFSRELGTRRATPAAKNRQGELPAEWLADKKGKRSRGQRRRG